MWDILRFLKKPDDDASEVSLHQAAQAEKNRIDTQLIESLSEMRELEAGIDRKNAGFDDAAKERIEFSPKARQSDFVPAVEETDQPDAAEEPFLTQNLVSSPFRELAQVHEKKDATTSPGNPSGVLSEIPLTQITPNPFQPRRIMGEDEIIELSNSIKELGVLQPIIVRRTGDAFELIAGERRFRAAQRVGLQSIPAMVMDADPVHQQIIALVENIQRKNLSAIEEARCLRDILAKTGWGQAELAKRMGRSQSGIANKIRLLKLDPSVQDLVITGSLGERQARSLLNLAPEEQVVLAQRAISEDLSARALETLSETCQNKSPSQRRSQKKEKPASDGSSGELLRDLAVLINRHRDRGISAQWKVKQMNQSSLIVEISVDINPNKDQYSDKDLEVPD